MAFALPPLPYDYAALEPHIDARTMEIHHTKHHQAYVNNLNAAIEKTPELQHKSLDDIMQNLVRCPSPCATPSATTAAAIGITRFFWQIMAPRAAASPAATWPTRSRAHSVTSPSSRSS